MESTRTVNDEYIRKVLQLRRFKSLGIHVFLEYFK